MDRYITFRIRKQWLRVALIVAVTVAVTVPATVLAAHGFEDVDESNVFHADINWLQDSGVTKGCDPPENTLFCPDRDLTREEMAAFLRRLAEAKVVDAKTAVSAEFALDAEHADEANDSGTLSGFDYTELSGRANATEFSFAGDDSISATVEAPATGFLFAMAAGDAYAGTGVVSCDLTIGAGEAMSGAAGWVDHSQGGEAEDAVPSPVDEADCVTSQFAVVAAGEHEVTLTWDDTEDAAARYDGALWVMWVPFGGDGGEPEPPPPPKASFSSKSG